MSLHAVWQAIRGRLNLGDLESDELFYKRLAAFKAVLDDGTKHLREGHDAIVRKQDEQAARLNELIEEIRADRNDDHR